MINLNLLPKNLRRRVEPGWWRLAAAVFVLATLATVGTIHFTTLSKLRALENERDQLQVEVDVLRPFIAEQNRLTAQQQELEKLLAVKNQLRTRFVPWSDNLSAVINQMPRGGASKPVEVSVRSISSKILTAQETQAQAQAGAYDGKPVNLEFSVQGEAPTQAALIRFVEAFESSPRFGINFQNASLDENTNTYTFGATVGVVNGITGASASTGGEQSGSASR